MLEKNDSNMQGKLNTVTLNDTKPKFAVCKLGEVWIWTRKQLV